LFFGADAATGIAMTVSQPMTVSQTGAEAMAQPPIIAAPTKDARGENFPVGSWLLPRHVRRHVAAYYTFARSADDIADSPTLTREQKIAGLAAMAAALDRGGDERVDPIRTSIAETGIGLDECPQPELRQLGRLAELLSPFRSSGGPLPAADPWREP
jgi:hypothetical protein